MIIKHILKDGTNVDSVDCMLIQASEHKELYELINEVMKGGDNNVMCKTVWSSDPSTKKS